MEYKRDLGSELEISQLFVSARNRKYSCTYCIVKVWTHLEGARGDAEVEEEEGSFARLMHNIDEANSKHRLRRQRQQRQQRQLRQQQRPRLLLVPPEVEEIAVSRLGHTFTKSLASRKKLRKES